MRIVLPANMAPVEFARPFTVVLQVQALMATAFSYASFTAVAGTIGAP